MNQEKEIQKIKEEVAKHAEDAGHQLNPDEKILNAILLGLFKNKEKHGEIYCPCRVITGDKEKDKKIICPCIYHQDEIANDGHCLCKLFWRKE